MLLIVFASLTFFAQALEFQNLFVPEYCERPVAVGDHVLMDFQIRFADGTPVIFQKDVDYDYRHFHIVVEDSNAPMHQVLRGMCKNSTRELTLTPSDDRDLSPLVSRESEILQIDETLYMTIHVAHVTSSEDYQIFGAFNANNMSRVLDMIEAHVGINAVDEYGQTPLMIAAQNDNLVVLAMLLNTRKPKVNVNIAKKVCNDNDTVIKSLHTEWTYSVVLCCWFEAAYSIVCLVASRSQSQRCFGSAGTSVLWNRGRGDSLRSNTIGIQGQHTIAFRVFV